MTEAKIISLLQEGLKSVAPARADQFTDLTLDMSIDDLQLDSVATMELVGFLEDAADAAFPDEELVGVSSLGDLAALLRAS